MMILILDEISTKLLLINNWKMKNIALTLATAALVASSEAHIFSLNQNKTEVAGYASTLNSIGESLASLNLGMMEAM